MKIVVSPGARLYRDGCHEPFTGGMTLDLPDAEAADLIAAGVAEPEPAPSAPAPAEAE